MRGQSFKGMRTCTLCSLLLAACSSAPSGRESAATVALPKTQVVFRQYYKGSPIFVIENFAGRDEVKLRSAPPKRGEIKPAYIPDDVMARMLKDFRKFGYFEYAGARPGNPISVGGKAELTIVGENESTVAFIRRNGQGKKAHDTYLSCVETFRAVHTHFSRFQAATGGTGAFGVKKVEFERR